MKIVGKILITVLIIMVGGFLGVVVNGFNGRFENGPPPVIVTLVMVVAIGFVWRKRKKKPNGSDSQLK